MSSEKQAYNLLTGTRDWSGTWGRTEPAAWAPADGETLAGGGCSHER